jgi:hypothetical protein
MALTDEEKFMFDLEGYVVLKNVLTRAECEDYIQMADAVWPPQPDDDKVRRTEKISQWGQPFLDLIDPRSFFRTWSSFSATGCALITITASLWTRAGFAINCTAGRASLKRITGITIKMVSCATA